MEKLFSTKNQHYVPRLLLRKFSSDDVPEKDRRSISMLVLKSGRQVNGASIAGQCSRDYFYGTDGSLELALGVEETKTGSLIKDVSPPALEELSDEQLHHLRRFVHWQRARTQGTVDLLNNQADAFIKTLMREQAARESDPKITPQHLELVKVQLTNPQATALFAASKTLPLIYDLAVKFILAPSTTEFVLSDHPVVLCNQFVENDPYLSQRNGWTGLATKGLQKFLPISPQVTLAVYDPTTYEYGSSKSRVCCAGVKDVAVLNKLQAITAVNNLYFAEGFSDHLLEGLRQERELQRPIREIDISLGTVTSRPDGNESQLISVTGVNLKLGRKFSFIKQLETISYRNYSAPTIPIRNEELLEMHKDFSRYLDKKVKKKRQQSESASNSGTNGE